MILIINFSKNVYYFSSILSCSTFRSDQDLAVCLPPFQCMPVYHLKMKQPQNPLLIPH